MKSGDSGDMGVGVYDNEFLLLGAGMGVVTGDGCDTGCDTGRVVFDGDMVGWDSDDVGDVSD